MVDEILDIIGKALENTSLETVNFSKWKSSIDWSKTDNGNLSETKVKKFNL